MTTPDVSSSNIKLSRRCRLLAGVAALAVASSLHGLDFSFTQTGFAEGATVTGSFSGTDGDGDGFLTYFAFGGPTEVTDFTLSFSGNSLVGAFTFGFSELANLSFFLGGDNLIGNDIGPDVLTNPFAVEGIYASDGVFEYIGGQGPLSIDGSFISSAAGFDQTSLAGTVATGGVPTPDGGATFGLLAASAMGLALAKRMRR